MQGINAQKTTMPTGSKTKQSSRGINHQEQTHRCQEQSHSQDWRNRLFVRVPLSMPVYFFISLSEVKMWGAGVQDGVFQEMQQWQSDTSSDGTLRHRALLVLVSETASPSVHQDKTGGGSEETMVWHMRTSADVEGHPDIVLLKYMNTAYSDMDQW